MPLTLNPGTLVVESAYPDPPFELMENGTATGFDIELMRAVCTQLGALAAFVQRRNSKPDHTRARQ